MTAGDDHISVSGNCKVPASPPAASSNGQTDASTDRLLVSGVDAARLVGLSGRTWRRLDLTGQIPKPIRIGGSRRWSVADLTAWIAAGCPGRSRWEQRMQVQK